MGQREIQLDGVLSADLNLKSNGLTIYYFNMEQSATFLQLQQLSWHYRSASKATNKE